MIFEWIKISNKELVFSCKFHVRNRCVYWKILTIIQFSNGQKIVEDALPSRQPSTSSTLRLSIFGERFGLEMRPCWSSHNKVVQSRREDIDLWGAMSEQSAKWGEKTSRNHKKYQSDAHCFYRYFFESLKQKFFC